MGSAIPHELEPGGRVRRGYWVLLAAALLLALAIPLILLCHATFAPLAARAYLTPAAPQAGQAARLTVVLGSATDRDATDGPWAQATFAWDMQTMAMGTRSLAVAGSARTPGVFSVPLVATMAGSWYAQIVLQTPGRPVWRGMVRFTVLPPGGAAAPGPALTNATAGGTPLAARCARGAPGGSAAT